jgi:hypothetical protein
MKTQRTRSIAFAGLLLACSGTCTAQSQSAFELIGFLTGRSYGLPDIEAELDAIESSPKDYELGSPWLELAYAKLKGPSAYSRLRQMENESKSDSGRLHLDRAIALSLGLTSFVLASRGHTGTHAEPLLNIHSDRPEQLRAALLEQNNSRGDLAVGHRFENSGRWSEPDQTLDENRVAVPDLESPVLETKFTKASGAACGSYRVNFVSASSTGRRTHQTPYLVNNSDLNGLLAVIGSCAGSE